MRRGVHVAHSEKRKPASAGGKAEFVRMAAGNIGERNVSKGRRDIGADEVVAGHACQLEKASGRDGYPAKVKSGRGGANVRIPRGMRQSFGEFTANWGRKADPDGIGICARRRAWLGRRVPEL